MLPIYHAFTQDISPHHQGKVTGIGGVAAWALSPAQKLYGRLIDQTGSFDLGFAIAGCLPLVAFVVLWLFWKEEKTREVHDENEPENQSAGVPGDDRSGGSGSGLRKPGTGELAT